MQQTKDSGHPEKLSTKNNINNHLPRVVLKLGLGLQHFKTLSSTQSLSTKKEQIQVDISE